MYAAAFAAHPLCHLVAVADEPDIPEMRAELNRELASEHGIPYIPDLGQALARPDVQIVSATPDVERRGRVAVRCLSAGKHLYLDKPLAGSLEEADAIVAAADSSGLRTHMYSFNQAGWAQEAKRAVSEGRIGELKAVHAEVLFAKGKAGTVPKGTVRQEKESVERFTFVEAKREMFDIGYYSVALIHWLSGRETKSVSCITGNYVHAEHARVDVEDFGALALTLDGGITATALGGRIGWSSHPKGGPQRVVLIGSERTLTFDAWSPRIEVYNDEPDFTPPPVDPLDPMGMWAATSPEFSPPPKRRWAGLEEDRAIAAKDVAAFVDCIEQGRESELNAGFAAKVVEVILAGYRSAARGEPVTLPLPRGA
jgi:predicted dehydrogenase